MKHTILLPVLALCIQPLCLSAQSRVSPSIAQFEKSLFGPTHTKGFNGWTLKERMAHYHVNGLSIAVIHNYKLEWAKGYGWADKEKQTPVTLQTRFQAGSVSKSVNALGILTLVRDGKLDLDADVNEYLSSWKLAQGTGAQITLAHLLSHTAGLNVSGFSGYTAGQALPSVQQVLNGEKPANSPAVRMVDRPGTRFAYSGGGVTVAQLITMDVTHQPYEQLMEERVLKPLGMMNSTFAQPAITRQAVAALASGYDESGRKFKGGNYHLYPEQAAAGLWSTPTDLAKYVIAVQRAYKGEPNSIISQALAVKMLSPYLDKRAGLGVFIDSLQGEPYFEHDGLTYGFRSQYYGSLKDGNGVVIMMNSVSDGLIPEMVNSIARVYNFKGLYNSIEEKNTIVSQSVLQSYVGRYQLAPGMIMNVYRQANQLFVQLTGQSSIPIFAETNLKFYIKAVNAQLEFVKENGRVTKVILYQDGAANVALRI
jgi:CubicO group peptidase (beta-lactamase class C family)